MNEPSPNFRLHGVQDDHKGLQIAMPLVSAHDDDLTCIGSSFLVWPGVAITAAHVVRDWLDYQEKRDGYKRAGVTFSVSAYQFFCGELLKWDVETIYSLWTADIAFLQFKMPAWWGTGTDQVIPPHARLNMNPPTPGETVRVFGFPTSSIENGILYVSPSESVARVREVTIKSRMSIRPTSYVDLDGEIGHGMSGGPCFAPDWSVVGMCSKGWNFSEDIPEQSPLSYMALLWPAMALEIDLYKTGSFPAWDLFKDGPLRAHGARRVQVTSTGQALIGNVDPEVLEPITFSVNVEHLQGYLNFAAENARQALNELRSVVSDDSGPNGPTGNALIRPLRMFFGELNSAIELALRLTAAKIGFQLPFDGVNWETLTEAWKLHGIKPETLDELKRLGFDWNGVRLFEIRTYAKQATQGLLYVECAVPYVEDLVPAKRPVACMLNPCRKGGGQISLPDGLERYFDSARRFSQRLLNLVWQQTSTEK